MITERTSEQAPLSNFELSFLDVLHLRSEGLPR